jgi:DNA polymerase I-like protein with 3'-5' exonuclease and polymerase domains
LIIGTDLEWTPQGIDVLGLSWADGTKATATDRNEQSLAQYLDVLKRADIVYTQNGLDADCRQLAREGIDVSWLEPKIRDTRILMHTINGHLAGTGSFDLRSIVLLAGARQGIRFPLDFKKYESDLHATCAFDSAAALWVAPTLERQIKQYNLEKTAAIAHRCAPIFARMREQGVRLDKDVLNKLYQARKEKTAEIIEKYHLWEERGKKVIKKVPIWRSDKLLDIFEGQFGIRPADRKRLTWEKLAKRSDITPEAKQFAEAILDLGKGANDAHWLGDASEGEDPSGGVDFSKVDNDGFIYPRYDLCGSPDRPIAASPNVQNFPRPKDDPRIVKLRSAVVPLDPSHVLLGVDFGSVETVTNAFESKDMDRVRAVYEGRISHEGTAKLVGDALGLRLDRGQGKAINHAFDKGESPFNLARRLFGSERPSRQQVVQCEAIFKKMLSEFPATAKFRDELWDRAQQNPLTVTNCFGRRLMCFSRSKYGDTNDRFAKHNPYRKYWCSCGACSPRRDRWKYAIAFLGRSAALDALLRVMSTIWYEKRLDEFSLPYLEVHDELQFSVPREKAEFYKQRALEAFTMKHDELGGLALTAEAQIGDNWSEAH